MKKKITVGIVTTAIALSMSMTAFAGQWKSDANGWWWQNDNGSYPTNTWQWIDGNNDGIAESYYFGGNGYCLINTTTPDGYTVSTTGAWTVNGVVQTQSVNASRVTDNTESASVAIATLTPVQNKNGIKVKDSIRDDFNTLYSNVPVIDCRRAWNDNMYTIYHNSEGYTHLKADKIALAGGIDSKAEEIIVEIYDASTDELLDSISITRLDTNITLDTNISGHALIKINAYVSSDKGYAANIVFKNLRFTK